MVRAPISTIATPPRPKKRPAAQSDLARPLRRWLLRQLRHCRRVLDSYARTHHTDRYTKRYTTWAHFCFLLFHGFQPTRSLHQSYASFAACPEWLALSGLAAASHVPDGEPATAAPDLPDDEAAAAPDGPAAAAPDLPTLAISFSQVAYANTRRRPGFLAAVACQLQAQRHHAPPLLPGLDGLILQDSTFLALSFKLAAWLPVRATTKNRGIRLQTQFDATADLPAYVWVSDTRQNDCTGGLDTCILENPARRAALRDHTLVLDLGYYSHRRFAALAAQGIHVLTRLHPQASVTVRSSQEVQPPLWEGAGGRISITADQRVDVGSADNARGAVLIGWRCVTATVTPTATAARQGKAAQVYTLLTDRWDLTALEVVQAYLWRWEIELFFRWLKSHLQLRHLLGYSRNAVHLSVEVVWLVHLLCVLAAQELAQRRRTPTLLALLRTLLQQLRAADLASADAPVQLAFSGLAPPAPS